MHNTLLESTSSSELILASLLKNNEMTLARHKGIVCLTRRVLPLTKDLFDKRPPT